MLLAELETYLSRPIAPTRRVALGDSELPVDPAPGFGGLLLGGIAARFGPELPEDFHDEVLHLMREIEHGTRVAQPRLRHRLQMDRVGLQHCVHRLVGSGESVAFEFDDSKGTPAQHVLCAVYAVGTVAQPLRRAVMSSVRTGFRWRGDVGLRLIGQLSGQSSAATLGALSDPVGWAIGLLDLRSAGGSVPTRKEIQRAFRDQLRAAHPDHGADDAGAAARIAELSEARRILLG